MPKKPTGTPETDDPPEDGQPPEEAPPEEPTEGEQPPEGEDGGESEGADQLGDAGKKALDAMKDKVKAERQKRRDVEAELEKLRTEASKKPEDEQPSADEIRREAEKAATQKANARIVRSEIRAAAAGKLADPKDALTFLDVDQFDVDENGEIDSDEVADAIDDLLKSKPYLAAQGGKRFQGTGDGGAARKASKPKQLTEADLQTMTPEQIVKAQDEGQLNDLLGAS